MERESALKAQAAAVQLQQEVQRLQAEAAEAQAKLADSEVWAGCMHHTECCAQASPPLLTQRTGCKAQLATAAQDAAGSAELQQEVNRLKSESAQAGPIEGPKSRAVNRNPKACSGAGTSSSRREAAAGSRETHS